MKFFKKLFPPLAAAAVLFSILPFVQGQAAPKKEMNVIADVFSMAQASYVDPISDKRLMEGALNGMMKTLDPYSQFLDEHAYQELKSDTKGEFAGIGLEVSVKGSVLHVISPLDDSPAYRAGLKPGDVIQKIDDTVTKDITLSDAVRRMRGKAGSVVRLTVLREGEASPLEIPVTRETVKVRGVREAKLLEGGIGYIRISEFQEQTARDFRAALGSLKRQGMKGLIIDVRNNPGGLLYAAVDVAENFIPEGERIVSTKGRLVEKNTSHVSRNKEPWKISPLYLLVNKGSASGSEILAGALQDYGLAVLVGAKTYGKGCIQTLTPLADGSAVRITTSRYYTPQGRLIHEIGVSPDVVVMNDPKDAKDLQLERALELAKVSGR